MTKCVTKTVLLLLLWLCCTLNAEAESTTHETTTNSPYNDTTATTHKNNDTTATTPTVTPTTTITPTNNDTTATTPKLNDTTTTASTASETTTTPTYNDTTATTPKLNDTIATTPTNNDTTATTPKLNDTTATTPTNNDTTATTPTNNDTTATTPTVTQSTTITPTNNDTTATTPKLNDTTATTPKNNDTTATALTVTQTTTITTTTGISTTLMTYVVYMQYRITNEDFSTSLNDPQSEAFNALKKKIEVMSNDVYNCTSCSTKGKYIGVIILMFSAGSVIADTKLEFSNEQNPATVQNILQERVSQGALINGLALTDVRASSTSFASGTTTENPVPGWGIALLVLMSIILLFAIVFIIVMTIVFCRRRSYGHMDVFASRGSYHSMNDYSSYQTHGRYAAPNKQNLQENSGNGQKNAYSYTNPTLDTNDL